MNQHAAISLLRHNSFGVAASARELVRVAETKGLDRISFYPEQDLVLGGGSNVLLANNLPGKAILVRIPGKRVLKQTGQQVLVELGAGEPWHAVVRWSLQQGYSGLENLSLIPGLTGAAPIQNIGAYGVELSDCLHSVSAWDWQEQEQVELDSEQCQFSYRDSLFRSIEPNRFLITHVRLLLDLEFRPRLDYDGIREQLKEHSRLQPTARDVSDAIIRIRSKKLPDPQNIGNAGSFFKNPLLWADHAAALKREFPSLPLWRQGQDKMKVSAAWMIEHCGWKGFKRGDAGVSTQHALVLVNHGDASGAQLLELARDIQDSVQNTFGITLENEPRIVATEGATLPSITR